MSAQGVAKLVSNAATIAKVGDKVATAVKTGGISAEGDDFKKGDHIDQNMAQAAAAVLAQDLEVRIEEEEEELGLIDSDRANKAGVPSEKDMFSVEYYTEKLAANPEDAGLYLSLAQLQYVRGEYTESVQNAMAAADLSEKCYQAYAVMGHSLLKQQKFPEAINAYELGLRKVPNNHEMLSGLSEAIEKYNEGEENMWPSVPVGTDCGYCSWCLRFVIPAEKAGNLFLTLYKCPLEECDRWLKRCTMCRNFSCWDSYMCESSGKKISQRELLCLQCQGSVLAFNNLGQMITSLAQTHGLYQHGFQPWRTLKANADTWLISSVSPPIALAYGITKPNWRKRNTKIRQGIGAHKMTPSAMTLPVGTRSGAYISSVYCDSMKNFKFEQMRQGRKPIIVTINGFLCNDEDSCKEWRYLVNTEKYRDREWWHLRWDSGSPTMATASGLAAAGVGTVFGGLSGLMVGVVGAVPVATTAGTTAMGWKWGNMFYETFQVAQKMGFILADSLARMRGHTFVLMGHSLGCHMIREALVRLAESDIVNVESVVLISGATDNDTERWRLASEAVHGKIHNYFSTNDIVLRNLLPLIKKSITSPIGRNPIPGVEKIVNHDCVDLIGGFAGHTTSKKEIVNKKSADDGQGANDAGEGSSKAVAEEVLVEHQPKRREPAPAEDLAPMY